MADTFKVDQVLEAGEQYSFQANDGSTVTLVPYTLMLEGEREPVTLNQVPSSPPPSDGDVLTGQINTTQRGRTFKKDKPPFASARLSNGPSADQFERRPDHPQTQERMRHTSALSAAPAYYQLLREEGVQDKPADKAEMLNTLSGLILWLEGTYPVAE